MKNRHALIIDDEPDIRELLCITLNRMGFDTTASGTINDAKHALSAAAYSVCLTDMRLPDGDGLELVQYIQEKYPQLPVAVITAHGSMDTAIHAMKAGAFDFVSKPINLSLLRNLVESAAKLQQAPRAEDQLEQDEASALFGDASCMRILRKQILKLSRSQAPIHIHGESGTGKELAAREIHLQGPRKNGPFIAVNCGAIPSDLMESEFFGHSKGSFTGANQDKIGLFQAAEGGTLFLDEVADLPLEMQVKLLRAIQEKSIRPIGSQKELSVNVRILSATHKDLKELVNQGQFRNDLYYRINVIDLTTPPLRDRGKDIEKLCHRFLHNFSISANRPTPRIQDNAMTKLLQYSFPGNVRELENILERAYTLCDNDTIEADDLHLNQADSHQEYHHNLPNNKNELHDGENLDDYLEDIEREAIVQTLESTRWNRTAAAKKLGVSFRSLRYRLKKLGLDE